MGNVAQPKANAPSVPKATSYKKEAESWRSLDEFSIDANSNSNNPDSSNVQTQLYYVSNLGHQLGNFQSSKSSDSPPVQLKENYSPPMQCQGYGYEDKEQMMSVWHDDSVGMTSPDAPMSVPVHSGSSHASSRNSKRDKIKQSPTSFPSYGCYCGPGNRCGEGAKPIDALDTACLQHDKDYGAIGINATESWIPPVEGLTKTADRDLSKSAFDSIFSESVPLSSYPYAFGAATLYGARSLISEILTSAPVPSATGFSSGGGFSGLLQRGQQEFLRKTKDKNSKK